MIRGFLGPLESGSALPRPLSGTLNVLKLNLHSALETASSHAFQEKTGLESAGSAVLVHLSVYVPAAMPLQGEYGEMWWRENISRYFSVIAALSARSLA